MSRVLLRNKRTISRALSERGTVRRTTGTILNYLGAKCEWFVGYVVFLYKNCMNLIAGMMRRRGKAAADPSPLRREHWTWPMSFKNIPTKKLQPVINVKKFLEVQFFFAHFLHELKRPHILGTTHVPLMLA